MADLKVNTFMGAISKPFKVRILSSDGKKQETCEIPKGAACFGINDTTDSSAKHVILVKDFNCDNKITPNELTDSVREIDALLKKTGTVLASQLAQMGYLPLVVTNNWEEGVLQNPKAPCGITLPKEIQNLISWTGDAAKSGAKITTLKNLELSGGKTTATCETKTISTGTAPGAAPGTATLAEYARDLTALAKDGKLDPVIGRDSEVEQMVEILACRIKNNPIMIGEAGVGKTAIVEGLAQKIASGSVPETLKGKQVFALELTRLIGGASLRGQFEERLQKVIDEVKASNGNIILFLDEAHTIVGAGSSGSMDASNILKPALARGELHCIGATTLDEYKRYIEKDPALERRFRSVLVNEPTVPETIEILKGIRGRFESFHKVKITDEAIAAAVKLTHRFVSGRFLPDKAVDAMDQAAARITVRRKPQETKAEQQSPTDTKTASQPEKLDGKALSEPKEPEVTEEDVANVVSKWTSIPVTKLNQDECKKLTGLETELHKRVKGQDEAVNVLAQVVRRNRAGLKDPKRPAGVFVFAGPTGVGKTELAKTLAELLFEDENAMVRIDMSEYMEGHAVARLIGAPPGYVGYEEGGQLTEAVRRHPYSIILFDEIEKAHPQVFNALLQVFDDGRLTDGKGRTVDFKNTIIIMTSNLGTQLKVEGTTPEERYKNMKENVTGAFKKGFRPEFLNRLDEILVFQHLGKKEVEDIFDNMINKINKTLEEKGYKVTVTPKAKEKLVDLGFDPDLGARPLRRVIQKHIEDPLANEVIQGKIKDGDTAVVDLDNENKIVLTREGKEK